jgi:hypothetical protein
LDPRRKNKAVLSSGEEKDNLWMRNKAGKRQGKQETRALLVARQR